MSGGFLIALALQAYRQRHQLTQEALAALLRTSRRTVQNWEQGRPCALGRQMLALLVLTPKALDNLFVTSQIGTIRASCPRNRRRTPKGRAA